VYESGIFVTGHFATKQPGVLDNGAAEQSSGNRQ